MSDSHIVEDTAGRWPRIVHVNIKPEGTAAVDALCTVAIRGGLAALHGLSARAASTQLAAGLAALDAEDPGYDAAAAYLTACKAACDLYTTGEYFINL